MKSLLIVVALLWFASAVAAGLYFVVGGGPTPPSYFTTEQARTGSLAYAQHCASCHGAALEGANTPALVGQTFWESWDDKTVNALYEYNQHWMPQGKGGTLSEKLYADTTAYMLAQNGLPSGEVKLEPGSARLNMLVISEAVATNQNVRNNASATTVDITHTVDSSPNSPESNNADTMNNSASGAPVPVTTLVSADIYNQNCARCHGDDGAGGVGPSLRNNPRLEDAAWTVRRIAIGGLGMPAYGYRLSHEELTNVTSYIRTNFNNTYEAVTSEEVSSIVEQLPETEVRPAIADLETASLGEQRYTQLCTACHGLQGGGGVGPPLAGNSDVSDEQNVITILLYGRGQMPGFAQYGDDTVAAISSYIRTEWGNAYSTISETQVRTYRTTSSSGTLNVDSSTLNQNDTQQPLTQTEQIEAAQNESNTEENISSPQPETQETNQGETEPTDGGE